MAQPSAEGGAPAPPAQSLNERLGKVSPELEAALSPLGRAAFYPRDIPFQAAQAAGSSYNATIGQITDGHGTVLSLGAVRDALALDDELANRALLYSPVGGHPDLRLAWNEHQTPTSRWGTDGELPCGPPLVAAGLTHAISLVADLFAQPGRDVVVPDPCWGNYVQIFGLRHGARIHRAQSYRDGRWSWHGLRQALAGLGGSDPVIVVLNHPSNPGGYSLADGEREELLELLCETAEHRLLIVLCDDAYAGLVYEDGVGAESLFWDLLDLHPRVVPIRGSGATKEFLLFGGRVGFLTLPFSSDDEAFAVLEDKLLSLVRSSVGSPVSVAQMLLLQSLRNESTAPEMAAVRRRLEGRYRVMKKALEDSLVGRDDARLLPCNSGAFLLLELDEALDPEAVRQRLLRDFGTGVVAIQPRYLRLAFCSVARDAIPELVERVVQCLSEIGAGAGASFSAE